MKTKLMVILVAFLLCASQSFAYSILSGAGLNEVFFQNNELLFDASGDQIDLSTEAGVARGILPGDTFMGIINSQNVDVDSAPFWQSISILPGSNINLSGVFAQEVVEVVPLTEDPNFNALILLTNPTNFQFTLLDATDVDLSGVLSAGEMFAFYVDTDTDGTFTAFNSNGTVQEDIADATDSDTGDVYFSAGLVGPENSPGNNYAYSFTTLGVALGEFSAEAYGGLTILQNNTGFSIFDLVNDAGEQLFDSDVEIAFTSEIEKNNNFPASSPWQIDSNDPAIMQPIPEPSTLLLLGAGLLGLGYFVRRRRD